MATVTQPQQSWQPTDTDRRVRHPLQALRGYIRTYVAIEGLMIAVIYVALWFWIGLALDFGAFKLFPIVYDEATKSYELGGFDWIQSLQWMSPPEQDSAGIIRIVLLSILVIGLLALVAFKVFFRLFVDYRDVALALVLERRFPKELGDRLITAVEMADPQLAEKYGISRAMLDKTIREAADRVEKLPVSQVFNWQRLRRLTLLALGLTVGLYLLLWGAFVGIAAAMGAADAPGDFFWRFNNVAAIWTERDVLIRNAYWPRRAHLDIVRFQDTADHPDEMRVGRDESRPDIQVRGIRWVIADSDSPDGWRALRWRDLPKIGDDELTKHAQAVDYPADWPHWVIDLSDLDVRVPTGVFPPAWHGKTSGAIADLMKQPEFQNTIAGLGKHKDFVRKAAANLLDWRTWTVDRIELEEEKKDEVRRALRERSKAYKALEDVFTRLQTLADSLSMERTLRRLEVPEGVEVYYHGKNTKSSSPYDRLADNKYLIGLGELKESVEFTVRGYDFYTRPRKITLVPPPSIVALKIDKEEPAYIYYRVQGDQEQLKGKKQLFKDVSISISGDSSVIQVPLGTNMTLTAQTDRKLNEGIFISKSDKAKPGASMPLVEVRMHGDQQTFSTHFPNVDRAYDFQFEFIDRDNVKGKRRVIIEPTDDKAPDVTLELDPGVVLRKPSQQKGQRSADADGYLVTPDALIPFKGTLRDDYGLIAAQWLFEVKQVDIELSGKVSTRQTDQVALVVSGLQFNPANAVLPLGSSLYWTWVTTMLKANVAMSRPATEETTPLEAFQRRLQGVEEVPVTALAEMLKKTPKRRNLLRDHNVKDEAGFDFSRYLSNLKVRDPAKEAQQHFQVKVFVTALDNNIETGPSIGRSNKAITFLVVSENELLSQIFIEEESLRERLEKVIQQLQDARTTMNEQVTKLSVPEPQLSLVSIRVSETQKTVGNTASLTREIYRDYSRILTELKVNRVKQQKIDDVEFEIVKPLSQIIDPNFGNFATAEETLGKLYQGVEADAALQDEPEDPKTAPKQSQTPMKLIQNRPKHIQGAQESRDQIDRLIERLKTVLDAMEEGTTYGRLLQLLVSIERDQREQFQRLQFFHDQKVKDLLDSLLNPN